MEKSSKEPIKAMIIVAYEIKGDWRGSANSLGVKKHHQLIDG